jgi:hypothetical protein
VAAQLLPEVGEAPDAEDEGDATFEYTQRVVHRWTTFRGHQGEPPQERGLAGAGIPEEDEAVTSLKSIAKRRRSSRHRGCAESHCPRFDAERRGQRVDVGRLDLKASRPDVRCIARTYELDFEGLEDIEEIEGRRLTSVESKAGIAQACDLRSLRIRAQARPEPERPIRFRGRSIDASPGRRWEYVGGQVVARKNAGEDEIATVLCIEGEIDIFT